MSEELLKGNIRLGQEIRLTVKEDRIVPTGMKPSEEKEEKPKAVKKKKSEKAAKDGKEDPVG